MSLLAAYMVPHPPLIIPAVGRGGEAQIRETADAYERVAEEIADLAPDTLIISSPHTIMYSDYFHISPGQSAGGSFARFGAPEVSFREIYDTELVEEISRRAEAESLPAGTLGERDPALDHGTMVPLYFVRNKYKGARIVRIGLSGLPLTDHYRLGQLVREAADALGRRAVWIASGDLSHKLQDYGPYGYAPEGPRYDARIMDVCGRAAFGELLDFDEAFCDRAGECGHRSFVMMAGAMDGHKVEARVLSHQDVTGVGYGICCFRPSGEDVSRHFLAAWLDNKKTEMEAQRAAEDAYVQLARRSLESYVLHKKYLPVPQDLPSDFTDRRAGTFVSLHEHGRLRGCIGTIRPVMGCVAEEIIQNAVSACSRDPRFDAVRPEELPWLEISVDVLGDPEPVSGPEDLDVKRYGVIVTSKGRRGLLLPDLEGVDTVEDQIRIARRKAGIGEGEEVSLERFEVIRHH